MVGGIVGYVRRKIYLYNVTFGLYMLDWWERYMFNILVVVSIWFIFYNGSSSAIELYRSFYAFTMRFLKYLSFSQMQKVYLIHDDGLWPLRFLARKGNLQGSLTLYGQS